MAWNIEENWRGRIRNNDNMERQYVLVYYNSGLEDPGNPDPSNDTAAATALFEYLAIEANIPGIDTAIFPQYDIGVEELVGFSPPVFSGFGKWKVRVGRVVEAPRPIAAETFSFGYNAQAKSQHIDISIKTDHIASIPFELELDGAADADKHDFNSFIGIESDDGEYKAKGADISPPPSTFSINWVVPNSQHSTAFQMDIFDLVGSTNSTAFDLFYPSINKFKPGELFLAAVTGAKRTGDDWTVTFSFGYQKDQSGEDPNNWRPVFGGSFSIPVKGHRYVWTYHRASWNDTTKKMDLIGKDATIYVEQVWPEYDWTQTELNALQTIPLG